MNISQQTSRRTSTPPASTATPAKTPRRLSPIAALVLLSSIVVSFLAASSAATPLYAVYQSEWHFSPVTTTVVFGVYAIAVLVALLVVGRVSDHVGRRPVILAAIGLQTVSLLLFIDAGSVTALVLLRVVQGLATGAAVGAVGAAMLDVDRERGTLLNSVAPPVGTATGALLSGLLVQYLPAPTSLVFAVLVVVFAVQAIGVVFLVESVTRVSGALASLRPELGLPRQLRRPVLVAIPVLVAAWGLAGFYASLGPALIVGLVGHSSFVLGGLGLFALAAGGAIAVLVTRNAQPVQVMVAGIGALMFGVLVTLVAIEAGSVAGFFAGTAVAGLGFGGGFQGSIRTVVPLAASNQRAGVLSILYTVSYLAMGLPAVIAGLLVVHGGGLVPTALEYGAGVMALAAAALVGLLAGGRGKSSPRSVVLPASTPTKGTPCPARS